MDSVYCHAAWAAQVGGVSFPLLADFHPKGEVARSYGLYLAGAGITDRATVIVDAGGTVRHASSVTPAGKRDMAEIAALCEAVAAAWEGDLPAPAAAPGLEGDHTLFVKDGCPFSRWALAARANLHLEGAIPVRNVSTDPAAAAELQARGGKAQVPALGIGAGVMYESADIIAYLASRTTAL